MLSALTHRIAVVTGLAPAVEIRFRLRRVFITPQARFIQQKEGTQLGAFFLLASVANLDASAKTRKAGVFKGFSAF